MVVLTTSSIDAPAASSTLARFLSACSVCASIPSGIAPAGSMPAIPEQKTRPLATIAWLYGPSAAGACSLDTARLVIEQVSYTSPGPRATRPTAPDHANRRNRAQVLDQNLVHGEVGQPDPLGQPVRQIASPGGLRVARVPEEIERSIGGEMAADDPQGLLRLKPERRDVEG